MILVRKRLNADADLCHARFLQRLQRLDRHIVGVKLQADPLGDDEVLAERVYDLFDTICRKRGRSAAEIQAGCLFLPRILPADKMYFLNQRINISVAQLCGIAHLAVGAEIADALAERNMDI